MGQDMATISSFFGALATTVSTVQGCAWGAAGGPEAMLIGCAGGYGAGAAFHANITNYVETIFNFISYAATIRSDYLTGDTIIPDNLFYLPGYSFGEDTITATHTLIAGTTTFEPYTDFVIDLYGSGYNHGYFCGMSNILNCFGD